MEEDLGVADMVLWVGISFEQSASTSYFRRVSTRNLLKFPPSKLDAVLPSTRVPTLTCCDAHHAATGPWQAELQVQELLRRANQRAAIHCRHADIPIQHGKLLCRSVVIA